MFQRGLAFLLLPLLTRVLSVSEFGIVSLALAVATIVSVICSMGINFGIVRLYYDERPDAHRTAWAALLRVQVIIATAVFGIAWITGPFWGTQLRSVGWGQTLKLATVYGFLLAGQSVTQGVLRAARRPGAYLAVGVVGIVPGSALGIALATSAGPTGYMGGLVAGEVVAVLMGLALTYHRPLWRRSTLVTGVVLSLPFMIHVLGGWVLNLSDRVFIERYLGVVAVGRYQTAYLIAMSLMIFVEAAQAAWAPHYFSSLTDDQKENIPTLLLVPLTVVSMALTGLLVLAGPLLYRLAAPSSYLFPADVFAVVAVAGVVRVAYHLAVIVVTDAKRVRSIAGATATAAAINIGGNLLLLPRYGLSAAAAMTLVAYVGQAVVVGHSAARLLPRAMGLRGAACLWVGSLMSALGLSRLGGEVAWWGRVIIAGILSVVALSGMAWVRERYCMATTMASRSGGARADVDAMGGETGWR